jgi:hypothetical protein
MAGSSPLPNWLIIPLESALLRTRLSVRVERLSAAGERGRYASIFIAGKL